ncbi:MAG: protein kinase, partial [Merismopedia sp. SIO2A8]|nr:protein kinase [Merismopedia sp. SIO2A8]
HPHLVTALGKLTNVPGGRAGLVFPFITSEYQNLGNPPSFESCTRDTYSEGTAFAASVIVAIAHNIASAVAHLHANGIMHGDLYAHNILVNEKGNSILGDFGAASFYDRTDTAMAQQMERLEMRAFGCLLEDLLDRYLPSPQTDVPQAPASPSPTLHAPAPQSPDRLSDRRSPIDSSSETQPRNDDKNLEQEHRTITILRQLQHDCLQPTPINRPKFAQVCNILDALRRQG